MVEYFEHIQIKFNFVFIYEDEIEENELEKKAKFYKQKCSLYANGIVLKDSNGNSINELIITN